MTIANTEDAKRVAACVKNHNGGRPKREKEETIKAMLCAAMPTTEAIQNFAKWFKRGERWAVELWFGYLWGKPVETQDLNLGGDIAIKTIIIHPPKKEDASE